MSRSTLNQYGYAAKAYHEMIGDQIKFRRIQPNNQIPFYFTEEDVEKIFSVIANLKHLAMLKVLFFGCLRASEMCQLNDGDLDLKSLTLRINGKGGQEGLAYINNDCANSLREYLDVRPPYLIDGKQPLFYTDYDNVGGGWTSIVCSQPTKKSRDWKKRWTACIWPAYSCYSNDCQRMRHKNSAGIAQT